MPQIPHLNRRLARLAAVQALYMIQQTNSPSQKVIHDFIQSQFADILGSEPVNEVDVVLFEAIVSGIMGNLTLLDDAVRQYLTENWTLDRLEAVTLSILRAGIFEIKHRLEVPAIIIISEYADIAHAFLDLRDAGFINGLLNKLARDVRPSEFSSHTTTRDSSHDEE